MKNKIEAILAQINDPENVKLRMLNRQRKLQELVDEYGVENVALAGGINISTLVQYLRVKNPMNIGDNCVSQAESVFKLID